MTSTLIEVKAPSREYPEGRYSLFLAGSIEMGTAEHWRERVVSRLAHLPLLVFNPRRDDWDSSWEQRIDNPQFYEQVTWELEHLERADRVLIYFSPGTKSPVSLMELGLVARSGRVDVVCPEGFWRKGNVDIVCQRHGVLVFDSLDRWLSWRMRELEQACG